MDVEGSSQDAVSVINPLGELTRDLGICTIIGSHTRKIREKVGENDRWETSADDVRGTGAFVDAARSILAVDKPRADLKTRRLSVVKGSFSQLPPSLGFDITENGLSWTVTPAATRVSPKLVEAIEAVKAALQNGPMRWTELRNELAATGISERTFSRALPEAAVQSDDGLWVLALP